MRQVGVVFRGELTRIFRGGGTFGALSLFFLLLGGLFLATLFQASIEPQQDSPLKIFWELQWLPNLIWAPLLTMRLLSQERKLGLLESTLATPTSAGALIVGKFLAAYFVYLLGWASVFIYTASFNILGLSPLDLEYLFDMGALIGGASFCAVSGAFFVALGLWTSSITRSPIMAATLNICLILLYVVLPTVLESLFARLGQLQFLQPFYHLENLSRFCSGEIELSVVVGYGIAAVAMLSASLICIERGSSHR